jgi:hypothetical protein
VLAFACSSSSLLEKVTCDGSLAIPRQSKTLAVYAAANGSPSRAIGLDRANRNSIVCERGTGLIDYDGAASTASIHGVATDQATCEKIVLCCGNVSGVAAGTNMMSVHRSAPEAQHCTVVCGPGDDDDDDDAPIGDPPDDDEDFDDEDDDDDEEPLQAAFCIAASPSAPRHGTMSRRRDLDSVSRERERSASRWQPVLRPLTSDA